MTLGCSSFTLKSRRETYRLQIDISSQPVCYSAARSTTKYPAISSSKGSVLSSTLQILLTIPRSWRAISSMLRPRSCSNCGNLLNLSVVLLTLFSLFFFNFDVVSLNYFNILLSNHESPRPFKLFFSFCYKSFWIVSDLQVELWRFNFSSLNS